MEPAGRADVAVLQRVQVPGSGGTALPGLSESESRTDGLPRRHPGCGLSDQPITAHRRRPGHRRSGNARDRDRQCNLRERLGQLVSAARGRGRPL